MGLLQYVMDTLVWDLKAPGTGGLGLFRALPGTHATGYIPEPGCSPLRPAGCFPLVRPWKLRCRTAVHVFCERSHKLGSE